MKRAPLTFKEASRGVKPKPFTKKEWQKLWAATDEYQSRLLADAIWRAAKYK